METETKNEKNRASREKRPVPKGYSSGELTHGTKQLNFFF